jgi:hypothetical protein
MTNWTDNIPTLGGIPVMPGADIQEEKLDFPDLDVECRLVVDDVDSRELHDFRDDGAAYRTAARRLGQIPGPGQAIHIVAANMALFDFLPGILAQAAPATITHAALSTLSVSKANVTALAQMLDAGTLGALDLLVGDYLAKTSPKIYGYALEALASRPNVRMHACRTHAKVLAARLSDGRHVTLESSANLRSCKNVEQATATAAGAVYAFHAAWIEAVLKKGARP